MHVYASVCPCVHVYAYVCPWVACSSMATPVTLPCSNPLSAAEWTTLAAEAKQEVATELARRRSIQCRRQSDLVKRAIPRRLRSAIAPAFDRCLKSGAVDMWPRLHAAVQACGEEEGDPNGVIAGWLKSTGRTPTQVSAELAALPKTAADAVRAEIRAAVESGNAKHAMIEQFRRAFEVDSAGLPRVEWESTEALKRAYTQARDRALAFARLLASSRFHGVKAAAVQKEKEEEEEDDDKDSVEAAVLPYEGPRMDVLGEEEREDLEQCAARNCTHARTHACIHAWVHTQCPALRTLCSAMILSPPPH